VPRGEKKLTMRRATALCALLGVAAGLSEDYVRGNGPLLWQSFKNAHGKTYHPTQESARYEIFMQNMVEAAHLERRNPKAQFGMSPFADLTASEFKVRHSLNVTKKASPPAIFSDAEVKQALSSSMDWRSEGAVTQVKDQGQCGSCWSFSSTGGIEGAWKLAGNSLVSVSEQELVSCDKVDDGCRGGLMDNAYNWLLQNKNGQIVTEESYSYTAKNGVSGDCESVKDRTVGATISGLKDVTHSESQMAAWLKNNGPLPIAVDASKHWQTYTGGVVSSCSGHSLDHGVLAVGYTADYWIVKNSWGPSWGESGYIRLAFGSNQCGLNQSPTGAIV